MLLSYEFNVRTWFNKLAPAAGLLILLLYWFSVRSPAPYPGYSEDLCSTDLNRQILSQQIEKYGEIGFSTTQVMTPTGAVIPYMSWTPERDWMGSVFWRWDRNFPFAWAYLGVSWLICFLGTGYILEKMGKLSGMSRGAAWSIATAVVVFHVPRHFKIWHHIEHLMQHWAYLSIFLDAWLWQRFRKERVWDWRIEVWRGFVFLGMVQAVGSFWGPLILETLIVHLSIAIYWLVLRKRGERITLPPWRQRSNVWLGVPVLIGIVFLILDYQWFPPLIEAVHQFGSVTQSVGWFANLAFFFRPLWLEPLLRAVGHNFLARIDTPETVVSVGWFYWVPAVAAWFVLRKKRGGTGVITVLPFVILLFLAIYYAGIPDPGLIVQTTLQKLIPFMDFFRVASRWGLFLPQILTVSVVLAWPELRGSFAARLMTKQRQTQGRLKPVGWVLLGLFGVMSVVEFTWLGFPVNMMPPLPAQAAQLMKEVHDAPGSTVLDMPFCVAGGNGVCSWEECPNYPASTLPLCLRTFHDKKIFGLYESRAVDAHCQIYRKQPYQSWFNAWRENRCFTPNEWSDVCHFLDVTPELSSILLYADIWSAAGQPGCLAQFQEHLGQPLGAAVLMSAPTRGGQGTNPTRMFRFAPHCQKR